MRCLTVSMLPTSAYEPTSRGKANSDAGRHEGARFAVGHNLQRAADEITGTSDDSSRVTHLGPAVAGPLRQISGG